MYFPPECFCGNAETSWLLKPGILGKVSWWLFGQWDAQGKSAGNETGHLPPSAWEDCQVCVGVASAAAAAAGDAPGFQLPRLSSYA